MTGKSEKGRRKCRDKAVRAPQPFSGIINQVCHKDKKYFEEHPDITLFLRRYVPGEFWPFIFPYDAWVEVRQIQSGIRMRSAVFYDMRVVEEVRPQ
jgi:hypothetical protein